MLSKLHFVQLMYLLNLLLELEMTSHWADCIQIKNKWGWVNSSVSSSVYYTVLCLYTSTLAKGSDICVHKQKLHKSIIKVFTAFYVQGSHDGFGDWGVRGFFDFLSWEFCFKRRLLKFQTGKPPNPAALTDLSILNN